MNRRDFLRDTAAVSLTAALAMGAAVELRADDGAKPVDKDDIPAGAAIGIGVIGANDQGKAILTSLAKRGSNWANVLYICDTFNTPVFVKKAQDIAPSAKFVTDYKQVLDDKAVQAVFVATPSHLHKQIVLDAIAAGKHVYCEAPLATDLGEAKDIAMAGKNAKTLFMPGIQYRSNLQHQHVLKFVRTHALGTITGGRAQWHKRESGRRDNPDPARAAALNWHLDKSTSSGLLGEVGIHQIDIATWFLKALPLSVTGFSGPQAWNDGRTVPDSAEVVLQYPDNVNYYYDATLASSYDGAYETFLGTFSSIQTRDQRAWMFKEGDAAGLGWEGFARVDAMQIGDVAAGSGILTGRGIALVADATKQLALGKQPGASGTDVSKTALYQAITAFARSIWANTKPEVGPLEGYQATVLSHKCHDAAVSNSKIVLDPQWFEL